MENTCNHNMCEFAKQLFDKPEQCPLYIETLWQTEKNPPKLIKDCANKRLFLMVQDLYNRLIGVQQAQEQQRNNVDRLANLTCAVVERMTEYPALHDILAKTYGHTKGTAISNEGGHSHERPDNTRATIPDNRRIDSGKQDTESGDSQVTGRDQED